MRPTNQPNPPSAVVSLIRKGDCFSLLVPGYFQINSRKSPWLFPDKLGYWVFSHMQAQSLKQSKNPDQSTTSKLYLEIVSGMVRYYESLFWEDPVSTREEKFL